MIKNDPMRAMVISHSSLPLKKTKTAKSHECDCACAYTPCQDTTSFSLTEPCHTTSNVQVYLLPDGWYGLHNPSGAVSLAVLNQPAYVLWSSLKETRFIHPRNYSEDETQALHQMISVGLLQSPLPSSIQHSQPQAIRHQLSSWLHITDRCNLRCSYCYLPHVREDLSVETGRAAVEATFRSAIAHKYKRVKLKYAGGEPLIRFPLISKLHQHAQRLALDNNLALDGVVLSNGTLLSDEIISEIQSLGLRLMISLDGVGGWHNIQRHYTGGRGSFEDISESIELASAQDLVPHISITVSGRNAAGLAEIVEWVLERGLPFSINFYRKNDFSVSHDDLKLEEEKIIAGMKAAFEVIETNLPKNSLLASLTDRANLAIPHERTCSVGQDYLVFDQNGQVAKCQMKMSEAVANVHSDDPLTLIREDQIGVQNISVEEKEGCRDCHWKMWCAGGCPLETYRATGRYDGQSPNCNIYKAIFPEVLRLEGLRLLKTASELELL